MLESTSQKIDQTELWMWFLATSGVKFTPILCYVFIYMIKYFSLTPNKLSWMKILYLASLLIQRPLVLSSKGNCPFFPIRKPLAKQAYRNIKLKWIILKLELQTSLKEHHTSGEYPFLFYYSSHSSQN